MHYEVVVEGYYLQVEVTHCLNNPGSPGIWNSDWDDRGDRELEFKIHHAVCYDDDYIKMDIPEHQLPGIALEHKSAIESAIWFEIDSRRRRGAA